MADNVPEVLDAQRFVLRDRDGRIRAALTTGGSEEGGDFPFACAAPDKFAMAPVKTDGNPVLLLYDQEGRVSAMVGLLASTERHPSGEGKRFAVLALADHFGAVRAKLEMALWGGEYHADSRTALYLYGEDGKCARLAVDDITGDEDNPSANLLLAGEDGGIKLRVRGITQALSFLDPEGKERVGFWTGDGEGMGLHFAKGVKQTLRIGDLIFDAAYAKFLRLLPILVGLALFGSLWFLATRLF